MSIPFGPSLITRGQMHPLGQSGTLLTEGMPTAPGLPVRSPNATETTKSLASTGLINSLPGSDLSAITGLTRSMDSGNVVVPATAGFVDLGQGYSMSFDPDTQQGKILPAIGTLSSGFVTADAVLGNPAFSYTGSDVRIILEATNVPQQGNMPPRLAKTLLECTTISIAVYRAKAPVPAAGYIGVRGFARGRRTIAGTLVLTQFAVDVLMRFLHSPLLAQDASKDTHYNKVDQLPPFNMTLLFTNEIGYASYCRLLGIELMNSGTVYSQNDMYTEQTLSYMASDMTPLIPITASNLSTMPPQDQKSNPQKTVQDVWSI